MIDEQRSVRKREGAIFRVSCISAAAAKCKSAIFDLSRMDEPALQGSPSGSGGPHPLARTAWLVQGRPSHLGFYCAVAQPAPSRHANGPKSAAAGIRETQRFALLPSLAAALIHETRRIALLSLAAAAPIRERPKAAQLTLDSLWEFVAPSMSGANRWKDALLARDSRLPAGDAWLAPPAAAPPNTRDAAALESRRRVASPRRRMLQCPP